MNSKTPLSPIIVIAIGLVVVFGALATTVFWMADPLHIRAPSDQKLLAIFHDHRAAFEKLRQMVAEDSQHEWYFSKSHLDDKIDGLRQQEYKNLFSEIQSNLVLTVGYNGEASFSFAWGGLFTIGPEWGKGIEYAPNSSMYDGKARPNLDHTRHWPPDVYVRQIEPHWFIFYQQTD